MGLQPNAYVYALPGFELTAVAAAPVSHGQLVEYVGDHTVSPTTGHMALLCGIAADDVAPGQDVAVYLGGAHILSPSGAIAAGAPVCAAAGGTVAQWPAGGDASLIVGYAMTGSNGANRLTVRIGR